MQLLFCNRNIQTIISGILRCAVVITLMGLFTAYPSVIAFSADQTAEEVKLGKDEADKFAADKTTKFVTDPAMVARVEAIGNAIAKVANEKEFKATYGSAKVLKFNYAFKIVDDKDINAFSLPGGFVYVNKALLDYTQSDDEIAGVMAHEIAHIAHHHAVQLVATQNKQMLGVAGALLVGAIAGIKPGGLVGVLEVGQLLSIAKTSAYGQKAELDADRTAVAYLSQTKYDPVGILTFMERLARDENRKPGVNYGIFMNHPPSGLRAHEILDEMQTLKLPVNRRMVTGYTKVQTKPVEKSDAQSVWISNTEIIRLADSGGRSAVSRADIVASELRKAMLSGARYRDVKIASDGASVIVLGETIISPTKDDAALAGLTVNQTANAALLHIRQALMKEVLEEGY